MSNSGSATPPESESRADGDAGARRCAAVLGVALCAEVVNATLSQDAAKVDLLFSFRDGFDSTRLITLHCQVKYGRSYRAESSTKQVLTLNIDRKTIEVLADYPSLLAWVPPKPSSAIYWHIFMPRTPIKTPIKIRRSQRVSPAIRYDLTRAFAHARWAIQPSKQDVAPEQEAGVIMARARKSYRLLQGAEWHHPLVGRLRISRIGWRHKTRRSKPTVQRLKALRIVPYLKSVLDKMPDRFVRSESTSTEIGDRLVEVRYLTCWYRDALRMEHVDYVLIICIREEVSYPKNWHKYPLSTDEIQQSAVLMSWWANPMK